MAFICLDAGNRTKPYAARLGPSAADRVGHFSTPVEAATAVACALRACVS